MGRRQGWFLDPWSLPPPVNPSSPSPLVPSPFSWALTCDGEDAEEDGYQRLDADAGLACHLLTVGELAVLIALANGHDQRVGACKAWPPVV